jgi:hypothetical protein
VTTWLSTAEVADRLGICREVLMRAVLAPVSKERRAWVKTAGEIGQRSARYRWRADRLDDWFTEAGEWQASESVETPGSCDGETAAEAADPTRSPAPASGEPTRSPRRSRRRSSGTGGGSLVELVGRLRSK